jgi:hypothetical protein
VSPAVRIPPPFDVVGPEGIVGACKFSMLGSISTSEQKLGKSVVVAFEAGTRFCCHDVVGVYAVPQPDGGVSPIDKESWHSLSMDPLNRATEGTPSPTVAERSDLRAQAGKVT